MNSNHLLGKEGTLALWDSEIYHSVPQHSGTKERIVIAFNINLANINVYFLQILNIFFPLIVLK